MYPVPLESPPQRSFFIQVKYYIIVIMKQETIIRFHSIHTMLTQAIDDDLVREFLMDNCKYVMEAVEFYEREAGKSCRFYKMGIKQIALDIVGWEPPLNEEAMRLLRDVCETHKSSTVV